ncbi:MAG: hypothetical protein WC223_12470 [Bacteroidales bacterium]|jgi:hypothetical protein
MLYAPEKYLNSILSKTGIEKDISLLIQYFISKSDKNLHFIIDEKELDISEVLTNHCYQLNGIRTFNFQIGQKVVQLKNPKKTFTKSALKTFFSPLKIICLEPQIGLSNGQTNRTVGSLVKFIPLTNSSVERVGIIQNRVEAYEKIFNATTQADFFSNEKLLVVGNRNLFISIHKEYPACFVSRNENEITEIEYNSPLLPKITVLKNINLLDDYLQQEINGNQITFNTCIFVGSSKFEHSINVIRNYYNQRKFAKAIFIGEKDLKIELGNNQVPLRWKWTIPEIIFFKSERNIQHKPIIIQNNELEKAIADFYQAVREIESRHTIGLKSIYRFIRRLYYDWNLKQETTFTKLHQIQEEFDIELKKLLIETLGNIFQDFNFDEYQIPLSAKFAEIIKALRSNNKNEKLKSYQTKIHQLVLPSFLCNANKAELNEIAKQSQHHVGVKSLQDITQLQNTATKHSNNQNRNFYSLTANGTKAEILSYSKSDDTNEEHHKVISSIYGSGKVEKLIERLGRAKSEYKLLLYSIEEKALKHHIETYISDLNSEYISQDRFQISGVEFSDNYYQFSNYDELIEALASTKHDHREIDNYRIVFTNNSKLKLPSSKTVLKIVGSEKYLVLVEDLNVGDKVLIYVNPDKKLLRDIMELKNPELMKKAEVYSALWRSCLYDAYQNNIMAEPLYQQLVRNHFSVSEFTFRKYIDGEVMFPRSFSDLIIIAKTINDSRLSFDFLKNTMKPKIEEYRGMEIEYGFKFSSSINHYIISGEADDFISEWLTKNEIEDIVSQIQVKTIKDIEQITQNNDD